MEVGLFEIKDSQFRTRLQVEDPVDWAIIRYDLKTKEFVFHQTLQTNTSINAPIDPFEIDSTRYFLIIYLHKIFFPGMAYL